MSSSNEALKKRVEAVLDMAVTTVSSLTESFTAGTAVLLGDEEKENQKGNSGIAIGDNSNPGESDGDEDEFGVLQVHD